MPNALVPLALFGWLPVSCAIFMMLPPRRALLTAWLAGWMFLPIAYYDLPGIPEYSKIPAITLGSFLGALLVDRKRIFGFRPRLLDVPMVIFCLSPFLSSLTNGLGAYDGVSAIVEQVIWWGIPYVLGRVYFDDLESLRELAVAIFVAGLVYLPLCLIETRFSPQLHRWVYGYHQFAFAQTYRLGGYRPFVFLKHGLTLGMFMTTATIVGWSLWRTRSLRHVLGFSAGACLIALAVTTVLCRSLGALALLIAGIGSLMAGRSLGHHLVLFILVVMPFLYVGSRVLELTDNSTVTALARSIDVKRAESLEFRFANEIILVEKALLRPILGWGRWGRSRVVNDEGGDISVTDGRWVIILGQQGLVGLAAFMVTFLGPIVVLLTTIPARYWSRPELGPVAGLSTLVVLYMNDLCLNGSISAVLILVIGALSGIAIRCFEEGVLCE